MFETRKISIWDMFIYTLSQWKKIAIACLAGAILFGALSYYKSGKIETEVTIQKDLEGFKDDEVENAQRVADLDDSLKDIEDYYYFSPVMTMLASEVPKVTLTYYFEAENDSTDGKLAQNIKKMYATYVNSDDISAEIVKREKKDDISMADISSLIDVTTTTQYEDTSSVLTINVRGINKNMAKEIAKIIVDDFEQYAISVSDSVAQHKAVLVGESYSCGFDQHIADSQNSVRNVYTNAKTKVDESLEQLSDNEKRAYDIIKSEKKSTADEKIIPKKSISKKYVVVGAFLGIVIIGGIYCFIYMFGKKIRCSADVANLTQSETLACISDNKKESIFSGMRRDKALNMDIDKIASEISIMCKQQRIEKLCVVSTCNLEMNELVKKFENYLKKEEIKISVISDVCNKFDNIEEIVTCGNIIYWEVKDKSEFSSIKSIASIGRRQKLNVIGNILEG